MGKENSAGKYFSSISSWGRALVTLASSVVERVALSLRRVCRELLELPGLHGDLERTAERTERPGWRSRSGNLPRRSLRSASRQRPRSRIVRDVLRACCVPRLAQSVCPACRSFAVRVCRPDSSVPAPSRFSSDSCTSRGHSPSGEVFSQLRLAQIALGPLSCAGQRP